jgi:hypothetical protein
VLIAEALLLPSLFTWVQAFGIASGIAVCSVQLLSDYASVVK